MFLVLGKGCVLACSVGEFTFAGIHEHDDVRDGRDGRMGDQRRLAMLGRQVGLLPLFACWNDGVFATMAQSLRFGLLRRLV